MKNVKWTVGVGAFLLLTLVGCKVFQPKTDFRGESVNRNQLKAKVDTFAVEVKAAEADLAEKEAAVATVVNLLASLTAKVVPADYQGAITSALAILAGVSTVEAGAGIVRNRKKTSDPENPEGDEDQ